MFEFLKRKKPERKKITFYSKEAEQSYEKMVNQDSKLSESRLILYTENWASLMEDIIRNGLFEKEDIEKTMKQADRLCRSKGRDYIVAKHILIVHWKYGEILKTAKDEKFYDGKEHSGKYYYQEKKAY